MKLSQLLYLTLAFFQLPFVYRSLGRIIGFWDARIMREGQNNSPGFSLRVRMIEKPLWKSSQRRALPEIPNLGLHTLALKSRSESCKVYMVLISHRLEKIICKGRTISSLEIAED